MKFIDSIIKKIIKSVSSQNFLSLQLHINNSCNLKCIHCYHQNHNNHGVLNKKELFSIIDQYDNLLKSLHLLPRISISGGEPLINPYLKEIVEYIYSKWPKVKCNIFTNGTIPIDTNFFKNFNIEFQISLDGPTAIIHDFYRGNGNFDLTLRNIQNLINEGFTVNAQCVLSRNKVKLIEDFFILAHKYNLSSMNFIRLIENGYGKDMVKEGKDFPLEKDELKTAMEKIVDLSKEYKIATNTDQPLYHLIDPKLGNHNFLGFMGIVIDYQGRMKLTSRTNFVLGSIREKKIHDIFYNHPLLKKLRSKNINGCHDCKYFSICGGGNLNASYAKFGSFLTKDPGCWI